MSKEEKEELREDTDVVVSKPEGDGRGNPYHVKKGSKKGGQFTSKENVSGEIEESSLKDEIKSFLSSKESFNNLKDALSSFLQSKNAKQEEESLLPENIISLKNFKSVRDKYIKATLEYHVASFSPEEIKEIKNVLDPIIKNGMLGCNFWFNNVLDFLDSDEIKNQFGATKEGQYGKGSGYTDIVDDSEHGRAKMSNYTFGSEGVYHSGLSQHEEYVNRCKLEKYGCIMDNDPYLATTNRIASGYGDAFFIMNDDVKKRTTFTIGDSLAYGYSRPGNPRGMSGIPSFFEEGINDAIISSFFDRNTLNEMKKIKNIHELTQAFNNIARGCYVSYIEAQMHGQLKISRDVYAVCASPSNWNSSKGLEALTRFQELGIKTFTRRPMNNFLEEIILNPNTGEMEFRKVE